MSSQGWDELNLACKGTRNVSAKVLKGLQREPDYSWIVISSILGSDPSLSEVATPSTQEYCGRRTLDWALGVLGSNPGSHSDQLCDLEHLFSILDFSCINHKMNNLNLIFSHSKKENWIILCRLVPILIHIFQGTGLVLTIFWPSHKFFSILFHSSMELVSCLKACCVDCNITMR